MKKLMVALLSLVALAGCSSDSEGAADDKGPAKTTSSSPTPPTEAASSEAPAMTLKDICPQVEAALPGGMIPGYAAISDFYTALGGFKDAGDLESQNALDLLIGPTGDLQTEIQYKSKGQPLNAALSAWLDGISAFADRCQAAGSSALQ